MDHKASIKRNSKYFFTYARKFSKVVTGVGPPMDVSRNIVTCPTKMANMLAHQYNSVFSSPKEPLQDPKEVFPEDSLPDRNNPSLYDIKFSEHDIIKAIGEISATAAAGPDMYPAILLKQCQTALSKPLYLIWRKSLDHGEIPPLLKMANIIPVHKGDSRGIPKNYRPIALTSHLIKIFEKVIRRRMVAYMEQNNLFNPSQHGFRHGRSCLSQLIQHYDRRPTLEMLEDGKNVDVIYI